MKVKMSPANQKPGLAAAFSFKVIDAAIVGLDMSDTAIFTRR